MLSKGDAAGARATFRRLERVRRGENLLAADLTEHTRPANAPQSVPLQRMLWESREALAIGITMMFFQQFSGINAVIPNPATQAIRTQLTAEEIVYYYVPKSSIGCSAHFYSVGPLQGVRGALRHHEMRTASGLRA